jgi:hypothetical protein
LPPLRLVFPRFTLGSVLVFPLFTLGSLLVTLGSLLVTIGLLSLQQSQEIRSISPTGRSDLLSETTYVHSPPTQVYD